MFIGGVRFTHSKIFSRVALMDTQDRKEGFTSSFHQQPMVGKHGVAYTVLRPSGKVMIDGELYDAYTRGSYIAKDQNIEVISDEGTSLKVKMID